MVTVSASMEPTTTRSRVLFVIRWRLRREVDLDCSLRGIAFREFLVNFRDQNSGAVQSLRPVTILSARGFKGKDQIECPPGDTYTTCPPTRPVVSRSSSVVPVAFVAPSRDQPATCRCTTMPNLLWLHFLHIFADFTVQAVFVLY
jgi:hypothetical protein